MPLIDDHLTTAQLPRSLYAERGSRHPGRQGGEEGAANRRSRRPASPSHRPTSAPGASPSADQPSHRPAPPSHRPALAPGASPPTTGAVCRASHRPASPHRPAPGASASTTGATEERRVDAPMGEELATKKDEQKHFQELEMQKHQCEPLQRERRNLLEEFVGMKDPTNPVHEPLLTAHDFPRVSLVHGG